jgi:hypothetical protein
MDSVSIKQKESTWVTYLLCLNDMYVYTCMRVCVCVCVCVCDTAHMLRSVLIFQLFWGGATNAS